MDSGKKKYESLEVVDLVLNDDFRQLVREKGNVNLHEFIEGAAGNEQNIRMASDILLGLNINQRQSLDLKYRLWMRIRDNHRKAKSFVILRYAAVLLLMISLGTGVFYFIKQPSPMVGFAESCPANFEQSKLILADGTDILLTGDHPGIVSVNGGEYMILDDSIRIDQTQEGFNQLVVPYGRQSTVVLADGTKVRLNSASRLIYRSKFKKNKREVYLEGEGYFEVQKNTFIPFYVQTDRFNVEVTGTTFNVQAYKNEDLYNTVLVEGEVNLSLNNKFLPASVRLSPNQIASLTKDHDRIQIEPVENMKNHISWVSGYLEFRNENVQSILKRIASYYNVQINLEGDIRQLNISGKLDLSGNPECIIAGIAEMAKMKYTKKGNATTFYMNKK
ncbi:MAG: FecR family protein [Prolixibacteraceae bacterium]